MIQIGDKVFIHSVKRTGKVMDISSEEYHTGKGPCYHIMYNEMVVGEALKADHIFLTRDEFSTLEEVRRAINKT